jgi:hypothetical protein
VHSAPVGSQPQVNSTKQLTLRTFIALTFSSFFLSDGTQKKIFKASVDIEDRKREGERESGE